MKKHYFYCFVEHFPINNMHRSIEEKYIYIHYQINIINLLFFMKFMQQDVHAHINTVNTYFTALLRYSTFSKYICGD